MLDAVTELRYTRSESFFTLLVVRHARSLSCFGPRKSLNMPVAHCMVCKRVLIWFNRRDSLVTTVFEHCIVKWMMENRHFVQQSASTCCKVLVVVTSESFIVACVEHRRITTAVSQV